MAHEAGSVPDAKGLDRWLRRIAPRSARGAVTIAILPDARVRALNKRFRGVDKATDVLSFPTDVEGQKAEGRGQRAKGKGQRAKDRGRKYLGDIVIARGIARKQATNLKHPLRVEFRVLALHGLLHLLGYDHEVDNGRMARVEARLRSKAGLPLGLIARSS